VYIIAEVGTVISHLKILFPREKEIRFTTIIGWGVV
jgi:hypothetical protein